MLRISRTRRLLWALMFLAALPLHFIYNSSIYSTTSSTDYNVYIMTKNALLQSFERTEDGLPSYRPRDSKTKYNRSFSQGWKPLSVKALVTRYGRSLADEARDVIFIADVDDSVGVDGGEHGGILFHRLMDSSAAQNQTYWLCEFFDPGQIENGGCRSDSIRNITRSSWNTTLQNGTVPGTNFTPGSSVIRLSPDALMEEVSLECRLQTHPLFWWLTTACNLIISCCLTGMVFLHKSIPLVTIGDVIESYLRQPSTEIPKSMCTYSYRDFKNMFFDFTQAQPNEYRPRERGPRWAESIGLRRWSLTMLWWLVALLALGVWLFTLLKIEAEIASTSIKEM